MAMYWSAAITLNTTLEKAVPKTREKVPRTAERMAAVIRSRKPAAPITAPNVRAQMISQTVFNMPAMPPAVSRSLTTGLPVSMAVSSAAAVISVEKAAPR